MTITWSLTADLDRSGTYETDLTPYVSNPGSGVTIDRGIGRDGKPQATRATISLNNADGRFTPEYTASPYAGQISPGVPVRFIATVGGTPYTRWTGFLNRVNCSWSAGSVPMANCECVDLIYYLQKSAPINVTASTSRDTDGALTAIRTAMGLAAGDCDFDDGVQDLPMHFCVGEKAIDAMVAVAASEMGGMLWPNALGQLRFEARNSRLGSTAAQTWGDGTGIVPVSEEYIFDPNEYVTSVSARSTVFRTGQADTLMFEFSENMFTKPTATSKAMAAGEVYERTFNAKGAYVSLTEPEAVRDYLANTAIGGTGTDRTSSLTVTVTDLGGGRFTLRLEAALALYVTKMEIRGQPVEFYADRAEASFSLSVPGLPAGKGLQFDVPFAGDTGGKLRDYARQELAVGRDGWPMLRLNFVAGTETAQAAILAAELGDLIQYTNTAMETSASYVNDLWYIEGMRDEVPPDWAGAAFRCSVLLSPAYVYRNLDAISYDEFDRADATGDLGLSTSGDTWAGDGSMNIVSNTARASSDTLQMPYLDPGVTDQVLGVSLTEIGAGDEAGVVFRYVDADNQYRFYLDKGSNEAILEKNVATTVTELSSPAFTVGTAHELRVINQDTRIRCYVDRRLYIDTTDAALAAGTKSGLMARNSSGTAKFSHPYFQGLN